jgi:hypothetical protein
MKSIREALSGCFMALEAHQLANVFELVVVHGVGVVGFAGEEVILQNLRGRLQLSVSVKQPGSDGAFGDSQDLADFGMLETLDVIQSHHRAVILRQLHHGFVQSFLQLMDVHFAAHAGLCRGHSR